MPSPRRSARPAPAAVARTAPGERATSGARRASSALPIVADGAQPSPAVLRASSTAPIVRPLDVLTRADVAEIAALLDAPAVVTSAPVVVPRPPIDAALIESPGLATALVAMHARHVARELDATLARLAADAAAVHARFAAGLTGVRAANARRALEDHHAALRQLALACTEAT
jgi:hypothetical protein